jgi:hypothetical protein
VCSLSRLFLRQVELSLLADEFLSCKLDATGEGDGRVKVLRDGKLREVGEFFSKEEPASIGNAKSSQRLQGIAVENLTPEQLRN